MYVHIIFGRHYHQIIVMVTLIKISEVLKLDLLFVSFICFELNKENVINMYNKIGKIVVKAVPYSVK
jgi:hypothetical protein